MPNPHVLALQQAAESMPSGDDMSADVVAADETLKCPLCGHEGPLEEFQDAEAPPDSSGPPDDSEPVGAY